MNPVALSRYLQIGVAAASIIASIQAGASSPAPPPPARGESKEAPEFSCAGKPLSFSREELEQIALREYEKKGGGTIRRGDWESKLRRKGCDWWVFFEQRPPAPVGSHFGVVIDGLTGKVKEYFPGA